MKEKYGKTLNGNDVFTLTMDAEEYSAFCDMLEDRVKDPLIELRDRITVFHMLETVIVGDDDESHK